MRWVVKTSAVRISTKEGERIYRAMDDVPQPLRAKIETTLAGPRSQTILIANQEAYDHILRGVPDLPPEMRKFQPALLRQRGRRSSSAGSHWKILAIGGLSAIVALWALWIWALQSGL